MSLINKVLEPDMTTVEIRELQRNIRALNGSRFQLSPGLAELRDLLLETHGVVEELLEEKILEYLYIAARPKCYKDGPSKLAKRFDAWDKTARFIFREMMFKGKAELARDYELVDFELFDKLQSLNKHRNNFSHNEMGRMRIYKDIERKKNLLQLMQDILVRL